jgi:shikimate dehydrogenase
MRRAFLIGRHIEHSLSPAMYNAAFASRGRDISYELFDLPAAELERGFERLRQPDCVGANVTMPHKRAAALEADVRSDEVRRSAAANLLVRSGSKLLAYNTDVDALVANLSRRRRSVEAGRALLIGAGGAASAVLEAFRAVMPRAVVLVARRREAAEQLAREAASWLSAPLAVAPWEEVRGAARDAALIVNATPIGMRQEDGSALAAEDLAEGRLVYDLVYRRGGLTELQRQALAAGAPVCDGLHHLLEQALPSYERYAGEEAPREVMLRALEAAVGRSPLDWGSDPP